MRTTFQPDLEMRTTFQPDLEMRTTFQQAKEPTPKPLLPGGDTL
jgi:hypothetical protein